MGYSETLNKASAYDIEQKALSEEQIALANAFKEQFAREHAAAQMNDLNNLRKDSYMKGADAVMQKILAASQYGPTPGEGIVPENRVEGLPVSGMAREFYNRYKG